MTEEDQPLDTRVPGCLGKRARPFDVGGEQVAAPSLGGRAGKVVDLIHASQRGTDAALIAQTDDCHFHRDTLRDARRTRRWAEEYTNLLSCLGEMANEGASDESRGACN